jgi:hypothetical protein
MRCVAVLLGVLGISAGLHAAAPVIISSPASQSVVALNGNGSGGPVSFSVSAGGAAPLNYQWQFAVQYNGATPLAWGLIDSYFHVTGQGTPTVTIPAVATDLCPFSSAPNTSAFYVRCLVWNASGFTVSSPATLTVTPVSQPSDETLYYAAEVGYDGIVEGGSIAYGLTGSFATITGFAEYFGTFSDPYNQTWQISTNGGVTWSSLTNGSKYAWDPSGPGTTNLTITNCAISDSGALFRPAVSVLSQTITMPPTQLLVEDPSFSPSMSGGTGSSVAGSVGSSVTFAVFGAIGNSSLTYRWQVSTDHGTTWANVTPSSTGSSYTFTITNANQNQNLYRVRLRDTAGTTYSPSLILSVY